MALDTPLLRQRALAFGVELDSEALKRCDTFAAMLLERNKTMNLTSVTEPGEMLVKHFIDSLSLVPFIRPLAGRHVVDVGTGAGFPGLPLLIANPALEMTLMDSTGKKIDFLAEVLQELRMEAHLLCMRAEEAGRDRAHRDRYDIAVARAVANLPELCEYCLPLVKQGGCFIAMKGPGGAQEAAQAEHAALLLGAMPVSRKSFLLEGAGERALIAFRKMSATDERFPRRGGKIAKSPLR